MATEDKRIDQLDPVSVLDLTSLMAMQQGTNAKKVTLQQLLDYLNRQIDTGNAVLFVSQTLTDAQKLQARTNIGAAAPGEGGGSAEGAVLYTEQTLTEKQQRQARLNIRCGSVGEISSASDASGMFSHAEGDGCKARGPYSHAEGFFTNAGWLCHAEGDYTIARGIGQHVQGEFNVPEDIDYNVTERGKYLHIVGNGTADDARSNAHTLDWNGLGWFAGGLKVGGTGQDDAEAQDILPSAVQYVEQTLTEEQQHQARANIRCGSVGDVSDSCVASGENSHAEGKGNQAVGIGSHAEGCRTKATGYGGHSEGWYTEAKGGYASHAEGFATIAARWCQHVQGRCNIEDTEGKYEGKYLHIVGNGESEDARSNAHTLDWAGVPWFAGDRVMLGGTGMDDETAVALMPVFVPQELTEEQKLQARTNIGAMAKGDTEVKVSSKAYLNSYKIVVTVNGVESEGPAMSLVRYDVNQTGLTEEQKAQARANIGVDAYIEQVFLGGEW